jgi:hypothetical protein
VGNLVAILFLGFAVIGVATLERAIHTEQEVRLSQIARIRDEVEKGLQKLANSHLEALHLLDYCINGATRTACRDLLIETPKVDKMKPPVDEKERNEAIGDLWAWLRKVRELPPIAAYGVAIDTGVQTSVQGGANLVRRISAEERPQGLTRLLFTTFFFRRTNANSWRVVWNT